MPVPRRGPRWIWAGRIVAVVILAGLTGYLAWAGLSTGSEAAGSISVVIALAALLAPYLLPVPQHQAGPPAPEPDSVEDSGAATATAGGQANTGIQGARGTGPTKVARSGNAKADGPGSVANTGIQRQPGPNPVTGPTPKGGDHAPAAGTAPGAAAPVTVTESGAANASSGGLANAGIMGDVTVQQPPRSPPEWPVRVGQVSALASAFQPRSELRDQIAKARAGGPRTDSDPGKALGGGVVLTQVLSGGGGVGKSQLAASCADQAIRDGTALVVWADASAPGAVIAAYAQAAARVQAPGATGQPGDAEADARAFLDWAAVTSRTWLVVLDDITDPARAAAWWPASHGTGWVLGTTRRRDPVLGGGGRHVIDIDVYDESEAAAYLQQRLTAAGKAHLLDDRAGDLADALGRLPLALSHAAAYMISQRITCAAYLELYTAGSGRLDELMPGDPDGHGRGPDGHAQPVTITLLLALDAAGAEAPAGLARPAMDLAAVLDPAGHPEALWATDAARAYLATYRTRAKRSRWAGRLRASGVTPAQARAGLLLLDRYGLVTVDEQAGPLAVRVHALTARAARETAPDRQAPAVRASADAILARWPEEHHDQPALTAALRASTTTLITHAEHADDALWTPDGGGHPLLWQAGISLLRAGLNNPAITHWEQTARTAQRIMGPEHPDTLTAQGNLAASYGQAGRTGDAIIIQKQVAATMTRTLGLEHVGTLTAQSHLAASYWQAGRTGDAIIIEEQVAAAMTRTLGPEHPDIFRALGNLAASDLQAGRTGDAIIIQEQVAAAMTRTLGPEHPSTLRAQGNLAASYWKAGRTGEAITIEEQVAAATARILGPEHPSTLTARGNLASSYRQAGRTGDAITIQEQVAADRARILGPEHPDTLTAQADLAASYGQAARAGEAITLLEQTAAATARILGPEHPDTQRVAEALREWRSQ